MIKDIKLPISNHCNFVIDATEPIFCPKLLKKDDNFYCPRHRRDYVEKIKKYEKMISNRINQ